MPTPLWTWTLLAVTGLAACAAGPGGPASVTARVVRAAPSLESVAYATVIVAFTSRAPRTAHVDGYDIAWPGGRFRVAGSALSLEPGETREHRVRVPASAGDVDALVASPGQATVEAIVAR